MDYLSLSVSAAGAVPGEAALQELRDCAPAAERYGLSLSETEMTELVRCRSQALRRTGRVEFGGGILPSLIRAFCGSPFVEERTWAAVLAELQEAFYYFKSDSGDSFTDEELVEFMAEVFNGRAQGSTEYLIGTSLEELCRYARQDRAGTAAEDRGDDDGAAADESDGGEELF